MYRHQLRAVREKLRLEVARSDQYSAEAQLARDQLKAEIDARNSIQVPTVFYFIDFVSEVSHCSLQSVKYVILHI